MKKVCVLTATRAEYGLLRPVIDKLNRSGELDVRIAVTGAHLSPEFGLTYKEIEADGLTIDEKIEILMSADTPSAISKSMALAMTGFADYFQRTRPDMLVVLGDRYETLAVCCAAMNAGIPIAHLYGGETTEGAVDECIRHSITKMSYLHFTSTEAYRRRVIQLGEDPERVFCVGAVGIENICEMQLLDRAGLEEAVGFRLDRPYAVVTFHPVTLESGGAESQFGELLDALSRFKDMKFIITKANADADGRRINQMTDEFAAVHRNVAVFESLGQLRYLSALKYCAMVVGNSSSGLIEAPSFGIPTVNIGDRQKGRLQADSVINCAPFAVEIEKAMQMALSEEFSERAANTVNPYGDGHTSEKIVNTLKSFLCHGSINLKKRFYDITGEQS